MIKKIMLLFGVVFLWAAVTAGGFLQAQSLVAPQTAVIVDGANGAVGDYVSMVIGSNGFPMMSYYDEDSDDLKLAICHDQLCSNPTITVVDATNDVGQWNSLQLNSSGHPVISYWDRTLGDVKLVVCGNVSCTAGNVYRTIDTTNDSGEFAVLALTTQGHPVIAYASYPSFSIKLATCSDTTCNTAPTIQTIASNASTIGDISLILNGNNIPHVAIRDGHNLGIAFCHNSNCATFTYRIIAFNAGFFNTGILLGAMGQPLVSYYDGNGEYLKLAICESSTDCQTPTIRTIDAVGATGRRNFFTFNQAGWPIFSYYNTTGGLFIARCSDPTCEATAQTIQLGEAAEGDKTAIRQVGDIFYVAYHTSNTQDLVLIIETFGVTNDDTFNVLVNSFNHPLAVLENDEGTLSLSAVGTPNNGGTVTISNTELLYTPAPDFLGTEVFTYTAEDTLNEFHTATVTVTVTSVTTIYPLYLPIINRP